MTREYEMVTTLYELNSDYIGRHVYLLQAEDAIYATTLRKEMDDFLSGPDAPVDPLTVDLGGLIYGLVLDPKALPYEISEEIKDGKIFYVFRSESSEGYAITLETHDTLEDVTYFIEVAMEDDDGLGIEEDFAIILAEDIEFVLASKNAGSSIPLRISHGT